MKRAASQVTVLIIIVLMSPPPAVAAVESDDHTCACQPMTTGCAQCGAGRCCSDFGYCGSAVGYCTPCNCANDDGTTHVCNPCYCLGGCPEPEPEPEPPEPDHDRDDEKMLLIDATYDPNLDNKASSSDVVAGRRHSVYDDHQYGYAAVRGPPPSNVSTHNNIVAGQCLLVK
ncbi:unnamed protein product [Linum trigynum]|uniref:Chitin-binding type-1 domain-containing protein n=1 Tax=Linum trigynum TaxID=586398 RepID=A0AAV2D0W5_9ROSI